jgi:hypothetical protein
MSSEKVKVKLRYNMAGPGGHFRAGSIVEFPAAVAEKLVADRGGEIVQTADPVPPPPPAPPARKQSRQVETAATKGAPESATAEAQAQGAAAPAAPAAASK